MSETDAKDDGAKTSSRASHPDVAMTSSRAYPPEMAMTDSRAGHSDMADFKMEHQVYTRNGLIFQVAVADIYTIGIVYVPPYCAYYGATVDQFPDEYEIAFTERFTETHEEERKKHQLKKIPSSSDAMDASINGLFASPVPLVPDSPSASSSTSPQRLRTPTTLQQRRASAPQSIELTFLMCRYNANQKTSIKAEDWAVMILSDQGRSFLTKAAAYSKVKDVARHLSYDIEPTILYEDNSTPEMVLQKKLSPAHDILHKWLFNDLKLTNQEKKVLIRITRIHKVLNTVIGRYKTVRVYYTRGQVLLASDGSVMLDDDDGTNSSKMASFFEVFEEEAKLDTTTTPFSFVDLRPARIPPPRVASPRIEHRPLSKTQVEEKLDRKLIPIAKLRMGLSERRSQTPPTASKSENLLLLEQVLTSHERFLKTPKQAIPDSTSLFSYNVSLGIAIPEEEDGKDNNIELISHPSHKKTSSSTFLPSRTFASSAKPRPLPKSQTYSDLLSIRRHDVS